MSIGYIIAISVKYIKIYINIHTKALIIKKINRLPHKKDSGFVKGKRSDNMLFTKHSNFLNSLDKEGLLCYNQFV